MRSSVRCVSTALLWGAGWAYAAINLNGSQAVLPLSEHDPSPIGDPTTYYPDQHDCPLPCVDYANIHSWIPYLSVDRLHRCQEPLLMQLSVTQPLDDPESTILLRTCTSSSNISHAFAAKQIDNPKKSKELYQIRLDTATACVTTGIEVQDKLKLAIGSNNERNSIYTTRLLAGMEKFFSAKDNCDENFLFAYYQGTVAGLYIGPGLGKPTAKSALSALSSHLRTRGAVSNTVVQLCGDGRKSDRVFGISIDTTGDLTAVQKTVSEWSKGCRCYRSHWRSSI
ncbi:chitinase [Trichophyton equinum CBS 127.97]|uniref:Chitinase n=1 Tax=Trichophyton equinum (strain ATCC MYA-4606 / CBS 127.97) TaxID=559882 RepID=F2Q3D6_TRIEC|nr:chitinase [Trichophyton equinum CBS 127.97]